MKEHLQTDRKHIQNNKGGAKSLQLYYFLFLLLVILSACDRPTRYQVLTTVFTGVPPYEEYYAETSDEDTDQEESERADGPGTYSHPVWEAGLCSSCHVNISPEQAASFTPDQQDVTGVETVPPELVQPPEKLCTYSCHIDKTPRRAIRDNLWLHNPVAQGKCMDCHIPHQGSNASLLKTPENEMCVLCHEPETLSPPDHLDNIKNKVELTLSCLECHTVHMGKDSSMLSSDYQEIKQPAMMPAVP